MKKLVIIVFIAVFFVKLSPLFMSDDSCIFFPSPEGCPDGGTTTSNDYVGLEKTKYTPYSIGGLVSTGGTMFLKSKSNFDLFLSRVENSEIETLNYEGINNSLFAAIDELKKAVNSYSILCGIADKIPYSSNILHLKNYDYKGFQENNTVNPDVFSKVEIYLNEGKVKEVFHYTLDEFLSLLAILEKIKTSVELKGFPDINLSWEANQKYLELGLFGQYSSKVFMDIRNELGI